MVFVIQEYTKKTQVWAEVARTPACTNDQNPNFAAVRLQYWFEKKQQLKFELFNTDKSESVGEYEVTLGKIMGGKDQIHKGTFMDFEFLVRGVTIAESSQAGKATF